MWKLISQSMAGSSHLRNGQPCQDCCLTAREQVGDETVLILLCADGAGSAQFADVGARLACETIVQKAFADLREGQTVGRIEREAVEYWLESARTELQREAQERQSTAREFACTLLLAVIGENAAVFAQIGDGAIVTREGEEFRPVFWPQGGEYANSTNFLTEEDFVRHLEFAKIEERIDELAAFTDGLQRLALNLATRTAHRPFFEPFFVRLRETENGQELSEPLRQFLDSPRVAQRCDDDKTLILATRVPSRAASTNPL